MAKTYKTYLPEQDLLLPPSLRDWLPENHLVYCVSDVVDQLDLSAIESVYEKKIAVNHRITADDDTCDMVICVIRWLTAISSS